MKKILTVLIALTTTACSILPYEEEFACSRNQTYGKCVSVEGAYDEAVTGIEKGSVITKDGVKHTKEKKSKKSRPIDSSTPISESETYSNYRSEHYDQLRALVSAPKTPIVKKAVEARTLILSYSPNTQKNRLYMPRYIYSIHQPAEFVLGQYLLENQEDSLDLTEFLKKQ